MGEEEALTEQLLSTALDFQCPPREAKKTHWGRNWEEGATALSD